MGWYSTIHKSRFGASRRVLQWEMFDEIWLSVKLLHAQTTSPLEPQQHGAHKFCSACSQNFICSDAGELCFQGEEGLWPFVEESGSNIQRTCDQVSYNLVKLQQKKTNKQKRAIFHLVLKVFVEPMFCMGLQLLRLSFMLSQAPDQKGLRMTGSTKPPVTKK